MVRDKENGRSCGCNRMMGNMDSSRDMPRCGGARESMPRMGTMPNCRPGCRGEAPSCHDCDSRMMRIQKVDFMIQEVVLYLDSYPECREALHFYHRLMAERNRLVAEYEEACGPLTSWGNKSREGWEWVKAPWPWQVSHSGRNESCGCRGNSRR